jgi:hypothetical protein
MGIATLVVLLVLAGTVDAAEVWNRAYGGTGDERGYEVKQTLDGGYVVAGETNSFGAGQYDAYLVRTDANGDTLWTKTYGGSEYEFGYSVVVTPDSGFIVAGVTTSFGAGGRDIYLVKTNSMGDTVWTKTYGGTNHDAAGTIIPTSDGSYLIVGTTYSSGAGGADLYILKIDANGDSLWSVTHGGSSSETGWSVEETVDGGFIIAGQTLSFGAGNQDAYVVRTDSVGGLAWWCTFGGPDDDRSFSVQATSDGGYAAAGRTYSFGAGGADIFVVKTDSAGDSLWTKTHGGLINDEANALLEEPGGALIVAGYSFSFTSGSNDAILLSLDANGDSVWAELAGGPGEEEASSVLSTGTGSYVIAGYTNSFGAGGLDLYIAEVEPPTGVYVGKEPRTLKPSLWIEPNPSRGMTRLSYSLRSECHVEVTVYSLTGQKVETVHCGKENKGMHSLMWDGCDVYGQPLPSGVYWVRVRTEKGDLLGKVILVR